MERRENDGKTVDVGYMCPVQLAEWRDRETKLEETKAEVGRTEISTTASQAYLLVYDCACRRLKAVLISPRPCL